MGGRGRPRGRLRPAVPAPPGDPSPLCFRRTLGFDFQFAVERGHADPEHLRGFLAAVAIEFDRFFNVAPLLVADILVESLAHGQSAGMLDRR